MYGGLHSAGPAAADALVDLARQFTPRVQVTGPALVLLDLRGLGRVWPTPEAPGRAVLDLAHTRALLTHLALSWSRVAALVLARARPGLTIVPTGQEAATLAPLPLHLLDIAPERCALFARWGLCTLGDLAALPARGLAERLGPEGARLRRLARGEDDTPLVPLLPPRVFECRLDLDWPVDGLEPLSFLLARILPQLCQGLQAEGRKAAALTLTLDLVAGRAHTCVLRPAAPSVEARTWRTLILLDLEARPPGDAIRAISVRAEPTPARAVQFSLLDPAQPSPERLAETLARLHEWTAAGRAGSPALLDSHRPGAFVMASFAPGAIGAGGVRAAVAAHVALRAFRPPLRAQVSVREGGPISVSASGVRGRVVERAGPWRASGDWWDSAWSREEWDVALDCGGLYRIFEDRIHREWFVEGELD